MVLPFAEQELNAEEIAGLVREDAVTVRTWLKRHLAKEIEGLQAAPRAGRGGTMTEEYRKKHRSDCVATTNR